MSLGEPPSVGDPGEGDPQWRAREEAVISHTARGDSIVATWGLLAFGHIVEGCFGLWALGWGGLRSRYDDPTPAITAVLVLTVLGWAGAAVTIRMLRATLAVRLAVGRAVPPPPVSPPPILLTGLFVLGAVCLGVIAVLSWQAIGVFPAIAVELMLIPLAMRTDRFIHDAGSSPDR